MHLGMPEILIILAIVLIIFGPKKLPELARSMGQSIREFRKGTSELREELEAAAVVQEEPKALPKTATKEPEETTKA